MFGVFTSTLTSSPTKATSETDAVMSTITKPNNTLRESTSASTVVTSCSATIGSEEEEEDGDVGDCSSSTTPSSSASSSSSSSSSSSPSTSSKSDSSTMVWKLQSQLETIQSQLESLRVEKLKVQSSNSQRINELEIENSVLKQQVDEATRQISKQDSNDTNQQKFELEQAQVIINLREELNALRQVVTFKNQQEREQNKRNLYGEQQQESHQQLHHHDNIGDEDDHDVDDNKRKRQNQQQQQKQQRNQLKMKDHNNENNVDYWKHKYLELHTKYTQLENDRAYSEFMLRNRITEDSLKYHRRLLHYKNQNESITKNLTSEYETQLQQQRQQLKLSAASVLNHTLQDLQKSQKRIKVLERQIQQLQKQQKQQNSLSSQQRQVSEEEEGKGGKNSSSSTTSRTPSSIMEYYRNKNMLK